MIYQIQTKFRDEARPRAGILRGREFVMKDSYSFDVDDAGLERVVPAPPRRLHHAPSTGSASSSSSCRRCRAPWAARRARSSSRRPRCGEDSFVRCAHLRLRRQRRGRRHPGAGRRRLRRTCRPRTPRSTPDTPTIETLVDVSNARADLARADRPWTGADTLKNVVFMVTYPDGTTAPLAVGLPGDREVDMKRLEAVLQPSVVGPFEEADFARTRRWSRATSARRRWARSSVSGIRYLRGSARRRRHAVDHRRQRARPPRLRPRRRPRLHAPTAPSRSPRCARATPARPAAAALDLARGIEIGHIFQLGRKYADALGLQVLDENGELVTVTMGSYGIGVSRAVAAIAEQSHDDKGLIWPREVAPADVHLIATGKSDEPFDAAERLAAELEAAGVRVLFDDRRGVSPGREVQRLRAARRPDHRRRRQAAGRGLHRGQGPAHPASGRTSPSTTRPRRIGAIVRGGADMGIGAVVFDWGGTLTPWHDVDLYAQWYAYAEVYDPENAAALARRLNEREDAPLAPAAGDQRRGRHRGARPAVPRRGHRHQRRAPPAGARQLPGLLGAAHVRRSAMRRTCWPPSSSAATASAC